MVAARATHKGLYHSDILGQDFLQRVDDHLFTQAILDWNPPVGGELPIPGTLKRRHAVGVDGTGRTHTVTIATLTADLWTRTTPNWFILGDDGALVSVTMTGLVGESVTF